MALAGIGIASVSIAAAAVVLGVHIAGPPDAADPQVTDQAVEVMTDQISSAASPGERGYMVGTLLDLSVALDERGKAEAYYVAGHTYFSDRDYTSAKSSFTALRAMAPGTILGVEASTMLAQIEYRSQNYDDAIDLYIEAYDWLQALHGSIPDAEYEISMMTLAPMLVHLLHVQEEHASAYQYTVAALDVINPRWLPDASMPMMLAGARSAHAIGMSEESVELFDAYLTTFPNEGIDTGYRAIIEVERFRAAGNEWGTCKAEEVQFLADLVADPRYRKTATRYSLAIQMVQCVERRGYFAEAEDMLDSLLEEVEEDLSELNGSRHDFLYAHGKGAVLAEMAMFLCRHDRDAEAGDIITQLTTDPLYGPFHELAVSGYIYNAPRLPAAPQ